MTTCFAYIRVSSTKQEEGVSLEAQREAIEAYAGRHGLVVKEWFQESQTAAKRGRSEFTHMLTRLKKGEVPGVIVHKIDRSARNLRDWADFAELVDQGIEIHLAAESLDLTSRGGRLSADIQAVVAADFIRNLRDETRKGMYGRLRQGLLPYRAPIGYVDNGKGQPKTIDPVKGPLIREMFERYATGNHTLESICEVMNGLGLRNTRGNPLEKNGAARLLRQTFYMGLIKIGTTREVFNGVHEPLISKRLFIEVQNVLLGKTRAKKHKHVFAFRKLIRCAFCGNYLIPERQKGHVYYRCHTRDCDTKCIREECIDEVIQYKVERLSLSSAEYEACRDHLAWYASEREGRARDTTKALELEAQNVADRLRRLTDLLLDGTIDREMYNDKKEELLVQKRDLEAQIEERKGNSNWLVEQVNKYLERAMEASLSYEMAEGYEKRDLAKTFTSNRVVAGKNVVVELRKQFELLANREHVKEGDPYRDVPRTVGLLVKSVEDDDTLKHRA